MRPEARGARFDPQALGNFPEAEPVNVVEQPGVAPRSRQPAQRVFDVAGREAKRLARRALQRGRRLQRDEPRVVTPAPAPVLYVVWNQNRHAERDVADLRFPGGALDAFDAAPTNVFLVKLSYWLAR